MTPTRTTTARPLGPSPRVRPLRSLTASPAAGRRLDASGVVIGPWSDAARRAVQAQRDVRRARLGASL